MLETFNRLLNRIYILGAGIVLPDGAATPPVGTPAGDAAVQGIQNAPTPDAVGLPWWLIPVYILLFVGIYFLFFRPQRKREKQRKEMQAGIKSGDNIVTSGGLYGKVADVGTDCFVVEFGISGRSVKMPVAKSDVVGVKEPVLTPPPRESADAK